MNEKLYQKMPKVRVGQHYNEYTTESPDTVSLLDLFGDSE